MNYNSTIFEDFDFTLVKALNAISILTFSLNCYVIWLVLTGTKRTVAADIFSLNLALSENFFCLSLTWLFIAFHTKMGEFMHLYFFSLGFLFTARPLFQTCNCVDYYLGVVHPVIFLKYKPLWYRFVFCCSVWVVILASCVYSAFSFTKCSSHYAFFIQDLFLMACVVYCCLCVLKTLKNPGPGENAANKNKSHKTKQKAFNIICLILVFIIIDFNLTLIPIPLQTRLPHLRYLEVMTICVALSLVSGIMQGLLYLHRAHKLPWFKGT